MIVHHVVGHGEVVDDRGDRIAGLELADGATVTDLGRTADLSALAFALADGAVDPQPVHDQDEVYVVLTGTATAVVAGERAALRAGSVLIVPARTAHHFDDAAGDFAAIAVFAPPLA